MVELVKRGSYFLFVKVDHLGVAHHEVAVLQQGQAALHLARHPEVVLVGKEDVVAIGGFQRTFEVECRRVFPRAFDDSYPFVANGFYNGKSFVCRAIVGHYYFVVSIQLTDDGFNLFSDESLTIICSYAN